MAARSSVRLQPIQAISILRFPVHATARSGSSASENILCFIHLTVLENERYLTVQEVVGKYGVTAKWLYRNKKKLPHSQPTRKKLLFPEIRFGKWWARQGTHD